MTAVVPVAESRARRVGIELLPGAEADAIVTAAEELQEVHVDRNPAVVILEAAGRLEISPARVRELLGNEDWKGEDIQIILSSYYGFITQLDDDSIVLAWLGKPAGFDG